MNIGMWCLRIAALYMVTGLVTGLVMGMSGNFALSSVHAHVLLLGWVTMALAGFVYIWFRNCRESRLAVVHFWGHNLGLPVMMASLGLNVYGSKSAETLIAASSSLVLVSLAVFTFNLLLNARTPQSPRE